MALPCLAWVLSKGKTRTHIHYIHKLLIQCTTSHTQSNTSPKHDLVSKSGLVSKLNVAISIPEPTPKRTHPHYDAFSPEFWIRPAPPLRSGIFKLPTVQSTRQSTPIKFKGLAHGCVLGIKPDKTYLRPCVVIRTLINIIQVYIYPLYMQYYFHICLKPWQPTWVVLQPPNHHWQFTQLHLYKVFAQTWATPKTSLTADGATYPSASTKRLTLLVKAVELGLIDTCNCLER